MCQPYLFYNNSSSWDAASQGLDLWEEGFDEEFAPLKVGPDANYVEIERVRETNELLDRFRALCDNAPIVYRTMLSQAVRPDITGMLNEIAGAATLVEGFDARRFHLTPNTEPFWQRIELELLRDLLQHLSRRPHAERYKVYQLLFLTAHESPLSPVAAWYLERAARLLLLALDVECIAMCRAVLEAALRHRFDDEELEDVGIERRGRDERNQPDFDLSGLILGARKLRVFSKGDFDRATDIRLRGNSVLHPPDAERFDRDRRDLNAHAFVGSLAILLRKLFPLSNAAQN